VTGDLPGDAGRLENQPEAAHAAPHGSGLWRLLLFDSSNEDPKWIIVSVSLASDVRPALMAGRKFSDWPQVTDWVRHQVGAARVSLVPVAVACWRIDEEDPR